MVGTGLNIEEYILSLKGCIKCPTSPPCPLQASNFAGSWVHYRHTHCAKKGMHLRLGLCHPDMPTTKKQIWQWSDSSKKHSHTPDPITREHIRNTWTPVKALSCNKFTCCDIPVCRAHACEQHHLSERLTRPRCQSMIIFQTTKT